MTTDDTIHELTGAYALNALDDEEREDFARHLQECDACAAEVVGLTEAAGRLGFLTPETPPGHLREAVLREVGRTRQPAPVVDIRTGSRRSRRRLAAVSGGLLAVAAAAAGVLVITQNGGPSADDIRAAADVVQFESPVIEGGHAVLLVSESQDAALITFTGLAAPEADAAYQLWVIEDGTPRPVEDQFEPSGDGTAAVVVDDLPADVTLAMTRETDPEPAEPTAPILVELPQSDA